MNIVIHRGANQIGGCITEISTDKTKIIIDFGSNLPNSGKAELTPTEIEKIAKDADAIFYTHYHGDHVGLHQFIPPHIPQYIGEGAKEIMLCKYKALKNKEMEDAATRMKTYKENVCENINDGDIIVTPYFVSHSAFNAYMFKIECDKKTILHTGDFRKHGYLGKGLFPTLKQYVGQVDILITEGTMLGRKKENIIHEYDIKQNILKVLKQHKYVFALCSSTDLDRLSSFHSACKQTMRVFYVDEYQKDILSIFSKYAGKEASLFKFDRVFKHINYKTQNVKNKLQKEGFLMPIRQSQEWLVKGMMETYNDEPPYLIYSMWNGYAEEGKEYANQNIISIRKLFGKRIYDGVKDGFHTSGHADTETLQEVCKTVNPRIGVIPIHKDAGTSYEASGYTVFKEGKTTIDNNLTIIIK